MKRKFKYTRPDGATLSFRTPATQREFVWLQAALVFEELEDVCDWLGENLIDHDYMITPNTKATWDDIVDYILSSSDIYHLTRLIVDAIKVPKEVREDIVTLSYVSASGGCECKVCSEKIKDPTPREMSYCRYGKISQKASAVFSMAVTHIEGNLLESPPFFTDVKQCMDEGRAKAIKEKRKREEEKAEIDKYIMRNQG